MIDPRQVADALVAAERECKPIAPLGTAAGAAVMGHPAAAVAWLVNTLAERGEHLRTGSVVLTGGLTAPAAVRQGRTLTAEFDQLGSVDAYA